MKNNKSQATNSDKSILYLTQWFPPEPSIIPFQIAKALQKTERKVVVLTGIPNYPSGQILDGYSALRMYQETDFGLEVTRMPLWPSHNQSVLGRTLNYGSFALSTSLLGIQAIRSADKMIIYGSPVTVGLAGLVRKLVFNRQYDFIVQDLWPESVLASGMLRSNLLRTLVAKPLTKFSDLVYRSAENVVVISQGMAKVLENRGVEKQNVKLIYNWAPTEPQTPIQTTNALREFLKLSPETFVVLYAGNLGGTHGLEAWVDAVQMAKSEFSVALVFIGDGVARIKLEELGSRISSSNVFFLRRVENDLYQKFVGGADAIAVSLNDTEGFSTAIPSKIPNALASGKIIIGSVIGDAAKTIISAGGLIANSGDPESIAAGIRKLFYESVQERDIRSKQAFAYYHQHMSRTIGEQAYSTLLSP